MKVSELLVEAGDAPTIKSIIKIISADLAQNSNGWKIHHLDAGDQMGSKKSKTLSIQLEKHLKWPEVQTLLNNKKFTAQAHTFAIQATYSTDSTSKIQPEAMIWLSQAGQIISTGLPSATFKHGDVQSFEKAVKSLMNTSEAKIVKSLYASGYHNYGRA